MKAELDVLPDKAKAITFRSDFDMEQSRVTVYIASVPDFPPHWGLVASEAFFNVRAALDHLTWELARWNLQQQGETGDPHGRTQFPIATRPDLFKQGQVSDLHPEHVAVIKEFQPYGDRALSQFPGLADVPAVDVDLEGLIQQTHLAWLMRISDHDKHRFLRPIGSSIWQSTIGDHVPIDCEITGTNVFLQWQLNPEAKWAEFEVVTTGPEPKVEVRDRVIPDVTFGDFDFLRGFPGVVNMVNEIVGSVLRHGRPP